MSILLFSFTNGKKIKPLINFLLDIYNIKSSLLFYRIKKVICNLLSDGFINDLINGKIDSK